MPPSPLQAQVDNMPLHVEYHLAEEERRLLEKLVNILDRLVNDPNAAKIAQISRESNKLESEANDLQRRIAEQKGE